jgi:hypothetical protein
LRRSLPCPTSSLPLSITAISWGFVSSAILASPGLLHRRPDNVEIQLGKVGANAGPAQNSVQRADGLDAYVWVTDVDSLYAELKERRANIIEPPQLRVYHWYEMVVEERFGFRLAFAMDTAE